MRSSLARVGNYSQLPQMISENGRCTWSKSRGQFAVGEDWWQRLYAYRDRWIYVGTSPDRSSTLAETVTGSPEVDEELLESAFVKQDCSHWLKRLAEGNIACYPVLDADDIESRAQVRLVDNDEADEIAGESLEMLCWRNHPCGKPIKLFPADHVRIGENHSWRRLSAATRLGCHTKEILEELGYSDKEISDLIRIRAAHEYFPPLGSKDAYLAPVQES